MSTEPSNTKDILSDFAAHVACFWGMWIPTISKHKQTDAWHFKVEDLPLPFDVRLPDLLQASMLHATLFRRRDHVTFHDIHSTLKQFDLRKARRRSIMHSATHAGRFLRLAETQGGIGIGSTHTDGKVFIPFFWGALELAALGAILDREDGLADLSFRSGKIPFCWLYDFWRFGEARSQV